MKLFGIPNITNSDKSPTIPSKGNLTTWRSRYIQKNLNSKANHKQEKLCNINNNKKW